MGTIYQIPTGADAKVRLLVNAVNDMISKHPDPQVAQRWAEMARESMARYSAPPAPTQPVLDLDLIAGLSGDQKNQMLELAERWLQSYLDDVRNQLMQVHGDMLKLQKAVAELESVVGQRHKPD